MSKATAKKRKLRPARPRATDAGCAGAVARVEVAISRTAGRRCRFVAAQRQADDGAQVREAGVPQGQGHGDRGASTTKRKLPRGTYAIQVRAVDAAGNRQAKPAARTVKVR